MCTMNECIIYRSYYSLACHLVLINATSVQTSDQRLLKLDVVLRRSIFLSDPVRPVGGVEDADGVGAARPSVLYASSGP